MKTILIIGAGKSSTYLIEYLSEQVAQRSWSLIVADGNANVAAAKISNPLRSKAVSLNVTDELALSALISSADLVISMMPPALHSKVAQACIAAGKHLLTASYVDDDMRALAPEIERKGLFFLCEMGLDPGIDHMSALQLIHDIQSKGGVIHTFYSHCGGLIHPDSDNNPWHYKITWNPRSVVNAGKAGAVFLQNGTPSHLKYEELFKDNRILTVDGWGDYSWYANRDSLSYIELYQLKNLRNFVRTTLRKPSFSTGWQKLIEWRLTSEDNHYDLAGFSPQQFFEHHLKTQGFWNEWLAVRNDPATGTLQEQLRFLGIEDAHTVIPFNHGSAADVLLFILENKLKLEPGDKDLIIMVHELGYTLHGREEKIVASLVVEGEDELHTAMAKTVSMPLGIAALLILEGKIALKGLHIPTHPEIYVPVLAELKKHGIAFEERMD